MHRRAVVAWGAAGVALLVAVAVVVASAARRSPTDDRWAGGAVVEIATMPPSPPTSDTRPAGTAPAATPTPPTGGAARVAAADAPPVADASPPTTTADGPAIVARPIPDETVPPPPAADPPWWAASTGTTDAGYTATDVGCAAGLDAGSLDAFFAQRLGPVIGEDYQHVVDLGDGRHLWLFQDTFVDQGGTADRLDQAAFVHNAALVQDGTCFTLYTRGSASAPASFEPGTGERSLQHWFWPMGGEARDGRVYQFWVRMVKDGYDPAPGDGLGWHPDGTYLAVYDATTLARLSFGPAPAPGVTPVYGYAVVSDGAFTYLFGNTFEQNLVREGGFFAGPHSATGVYLARVPLGQYTTAPEYRAADGTWSADRAAAAPISSRFWVENPMQPRYLDGQWVAVTKVDGYWGEELSVDVATEPWGPWTTTVRRHLLPRHGDPLMNTYHAHLLPWLHDGALVVSISQNARNMLRDAYPHPVRYRLQFFTEALVAPPAIAATAPVDEPPTTTSTTTSTTTTPPSTSTSTSTSSTSSSTTSSTTEPPTSSSSTEPTSSATSTSSTSTTTPSTDDHGQSPD